MYESSASFKYSSKSKNHSPDAYFETTVATNKHESSEGAEFTALVVEPKPVENESESTSVEFQIGIDMLANAEDTAMTDDSKLLVGVNEQFQLELKKESETEIVSPTDSADHSETNTEVQQSDAILVQSSLESKTDVGAQEEHTKGEEQQEQKVEQDEQQELTGEHEETDKQSVGTKLDLSGSEIISDTKSESGKQDTESHAEETQSEHELLNGNEIKSETVAEVQSQESVSMVESNSVAISSVEGTTTSEEVAEGTLPRGMLYPFWASFVWPRTSLILPIRRMEN